MFRPGNTVGKIGESLAAMFLMKQGFRVKGRNYWRKWGEIDIIAQKDNKTHFVEVKSVSCENIDLISLKNNTDYRPEENLHKRKMSRLARVIETYLQEHVDVDDWCIDAIIVYVDQEHKKSKIRMIENIIL